MERFWSKVDKSSDCWIWTGGISSSGYGSFGVGGSKGQMYNAHRVAWELVNGPIPEGMFVFTSVTTRYVYYLTTYFLAQRKIIQTI